MPQIIEVRSHSNPNVFYRVDVEGNRCSCPAWRFHKGGRVPCKHLKALAAGRSIPGARVVDLDAAEISRTWPVKAPTLDL